MVSGHLAAYLDCEPLAGRSVIPAQPKPRAAALPLNIGASLIVVLLLSVGLWAAILGAVYDGLTARRRRPPPARESMWRMADVSGPPPPGGRPPDGHCPCPRGGPWLHRTSAC